MEQGDIQIDRTTVAGLRNFNGTFTNQANITIGTNAVVGTCGIRNQAAFANNAGGNIKVDNATEGIFVEDNSFANAGSITIGGINAVGTLLSRQGSGNFSNNAGGNFKATGQIAAAGFTNAGGTLSPGYSPGKLTFNESKDFSNSITDIEINGAGIAGVNYDQIEVLGTATLGGTLKVTVNYNPVDGDEITILTASTISGKFSAISGGNLWRIEYSDNAIKLTYDSSLPVNLVEFNARATGSTIQLSWRTASETDNAGFHIERSSNGMSWQDIGFVAGNGTVSKVQDYHFQDISPILGLNYYRLRQIDFDGKTEHSSVQVAKFEGDDYELIVWADEARQAHIQTEHRIEQVTVFDLSGRIVGASKLKTLDLSHVNGGLLLVRIQTSNRIVTKKLLLP
jgi:hypothetical protein